MIPVEDPAAVRQLEEVLEINLADDVQAWSLSADRSWHRVPTVRGVSTQDTLRALALERSVPHDESRRPRPAEDEHGTRARRTRP